MVTMSYTRTYATTPELAYEALINVSLPDVLGHRSLAIPGIREVKPGPTGWGSVGDTRTVVLNDGGTSLETLVRAERPTQFAYQITELTGPLARLVASIYGTFEFAPAAAGTAVTWTWDLQPKGLPGRLIMPAFRPMWERWARGCFDTLEGVLAPAT